MTNDVRVRRIVGAGPARIILSAAEPDKDEAEQYLAGTRAPLPTRRLNAIVFNVQTNRAARTIVALEQRRVLVVQRLNSIDVPFVREDVETALRIAAQNEDARRATRTPLERFRVVEPSNDTPEQYVVQGLPVRSIRRSDACSVDRCLDLLFRTPSGYLPFRVLVDLTKRSSTFEGRKR